MQKLTGYSHVVVASLSDNSLHYYADYDESSDYMAYFVHDDILVTSEEGGFDFATVLEVLSYKDFKAKYPGSRPITQEVVSSLDMENYHKRVSKRKAKRKLTDKMNSIISKLSIDEKYALLAAQDPDFNKLYQRYLEEG